MTKTKNALKGKFILCLSEPHPVFADVRAIGAFIKNLGLEKAFQVAGWFDRSAIACEIIECTHMNRAVATHEQSALRILYLLLKELSESGDLYAAEDITRYTKTANRALVKKQ